MKIIIINTPAVLLLCLLFNMFSILDLNLYAQGFDQDQNKKIYKTAILLVNKFEMTLQTEGEKFFSPTLHTLIQASLFGDRYKWLKIVSDSTNFIGINRFVLNGNILDYFNYLKINIKIISRENNKLIDYRSYEIEPDSILAGVDRMGKEIASIISKSISTNEEENRISVLILPLESDIQDSTSNKIGDYLTSSFLYEFKKLPITSKVEIKTSEVSKDQISKEFNLILKGTFHLYEDNSSDISVSLLNAETGQKIYTVSSYIDSKDYLDGPKKISYRFNNFMIVYQDVRDELLSFHEAKDFYEQGEKYFVDLIDPNAKIKAEVMYYKAVEIDPSYVSALIRLGDLAKEDYRYDQAISFYNQILEIDSLNIEVILSLGDIYYSNLQDSLAIQNFKEAANLARQKNQDSSIVKAYKKLGELYLANGDYSEAINYYDQAVILDKSDPLIWYGLGNAYYSRYYDSYRKLEDTTDIYEAVNYFLKGKSRFPNDSTFARNASYILNYWGKVYYEEYSNKYYDTISTYLELETLRNLAINKFNEASQITNYDHNLMAENFNYLAWLSYVLWDYEKGKDYSRKALQLNPSDEWTYRLFAFLYKDDSTSVKEALHSIKKAISIEKSANSYRILGDIYLNMKLYDSAYVAYQSTREIEYIPSFSTMEGLFNSAIMSKKPDLIKSCELEINDYMQRSIQMEDSLWALNSLAEIKRAQKDYDSALSYVKQAFEINSDSKGATSILDSLYFVDSFQPAYELRIATLEKKVKEGSNSEEDTKWNGYFIGVEYYTLGEKFYSENNSTEGNSFMLKAIDQFSLFPDWEYSLNYLQLIYHEYIIDFEKSYQFSLDLIILDSSNETYILNYIEAAFTTRRFKEAYDRAEKIIVSDSLNGQPLDITSKLAIRYILLAAKLIDQDPMASFVEFGEFKRVYSKFDKKDSNWIWSGTKKFIQESNDIDTIYRDDILLKIMTTFEVERNEGLIILSEVETKWKDLLTVK